MPLPITNLTAHFDASTSAKVFNTGASPATDGQLVERWADAEGKDLAYWYLSDTTREPTYRSSATLMQASCVDFDGTTDVMGLYNNPGSVSKTLADVLGASAKTIILSVYVEYCPDVGVVPVYQYDPIIGDASQYFGIFISNNSGVYKLNAYNYDGTADTIQVTISLNTSYVVMLRHNGTNLYLSVDGGAESSTASGATQVTTGQMRLGYVVSTGIFSGRIGEVAIYNVDLSTQSTDLATAISYFTSKWIPTSNVTVVLSGAVSNARAGTASGPYDPTVLLPAVYYDTTYTTPTGTTIVVGDGGNFQTALNTANLGDVITLNAGSTYTATTFTLPAGKTGSGYIVIRSSATLTTEGVRITTAQAAAFPKITTNGTTPAIQAAASSSYYRFINCEFTSSSIAVNGGLVQLGSGAENSTSLFPHHIILDRCYIHGDATNGGRRGVMLSGNYQAIIDSYVSDWKEVGADTQAIAGWTGEGPYKVVNNYVEGAGENILFGGSDTQITNLIPADIEISNNYFFKPLTWKIGDPSYLGIHWAVKNSFELKNCKRVLIENNLIENNWADGQVGFAVLFTVRNQQTTNPWATVQDVTFRNNELKNSDNGINLMGWDTESGIPSDYARRCLISDNLLTNIGGQWYGDGILFQIGVGYQDITIDHNTLLFDPAVPGTGTTISAYSYSCPRFQFTNNICQHGQYGIVGDGTNPGNPSIAQHFPGSTITNNVIQTPAGWGPQTLPPQVGDPFDGQWYPAGNYFPHQVADIQFVNYPTDLHLSLSSPYQNKGTAGTDPGYVETAAATFNPAWAVNVNQLVM